MTEQLYRVAREAVISGPFLAVDVPCDAPPDPRCPAARFVCDETQCNVVGITVELQHMQGPVPALACPVCRAHLRLECYVSQELLVPA